MANLLCLLIGHKKTLGAFSRHRFYCVRCGLDLGVATEPPVPPPPMPPTTVRRISKRQRYR